MAYTLITGPITEPITLDEAKAWIRETTTDLDDIITPLITAARKAAEDFQNIDYMTQTWELWLDYIPKMPLELRQALQSVVSAKVYDVNDAEYTIPLDDLFVDTKGRPGRITFRNGKTWPNFSPREINCFSCQFTSGADVSETTKLAMKFYIRTAIDDPDGVKMESFLKTFRQLLAPERRIPV